MGAFALLFVGVGAIISLGPDPTAGTLEVGNSGSLGSAAATFSLSCHARGVSPVGVAAGALGLSTDEIRTGIAEWQARASYCERKIWAGGMRKDKLNSNMPT